MLMESGAAASEPEVTLRSLTLLGSLGDVEITWDENNDEAMREIIAKKMAEGVTFFEIKQGLIRKRKPKVKNVGDLKANSVYIHDEDIQRMFSEGRVEFSRNGDKIETTGVIRDPAVAAKSRTAAVPRPGGG
jgi:hypothetical protein